MCKASWPNQLKQTLKRYRPDGSPRVAIVGIGNEFAGDDVAGLAVVRALPPALTTEQEHLLVVDAGPAPENCTGALRRFAPDLVLLVDAARMDEPPGTIRWLAWQETTGLSASTHTLPPYVLAQYLLESLKCEVVLIGIQPEHLDMAQSCSPAVQQAIDEAVAVLTETFG